MRIAIPLLLLVLPVGLVHSRPAVVAQPSDGDEPRIVLRTGDGREQAGVPGTIAWDDLLGDDFRPFVPPDPLDVGASDQLTLDFASTGAPLALAYRAYRLDDGAVQERSAAWLAIDPAACVVAAGELPPGGNVTLPLALPPAAYAVEVYAHLSEWRYVWQGFHLALTEGRDAGGEATCLPPAPTVAETAATPAAAPTAAAARIECPLQVEVGEVASLRLTGSGEVKVAVSAGGFPPSSLSANGLLASRLNHEGTGLRGTLSAQPVFLAWRVTDVGTLIVEYEPGSEGDATPPARISVGVFTASRPLTLLANCGVLADRWYPGGPPAATTRLATELYSVAYAS